MKIIATLSKVSLQKVLNFVQIYVQKILYLYVTSSTQFHKKL